MKTEVCFSCQRVTQTLTLWLVGTIGGLIGPSTDTWSNSITEPTPVFILSEIEHKAMDRVLLLEPQPRSTPECLPQSLPGGTRKVASDAGGTALECDALVYDNPTLDRFHVEDRLSSAILDQKHDFHNKEVIRPLDLGAGNEETTHLPVGSLTAGTRNDGSQHPEKRKRAMTPDEERKVRRTLPERSQSLGSRKEARVSTVATRLKYPERN